MNAYSPYTGLLKVEIYHLDVPFEKQEYENLLNNSNCFVIKEEFNYSGQRKDNPVITVWYEENS